MALRSTHLAYRTLAFAAALAVPGLAAAQQQMLPAQALSAFAAQAKAQGLRAADVADLLINSSHVEAETGITHTYLQQRVNGLAIFNATGAVHTDQRGQVLFTVQDFVPGAAALVPSAVPALTPEQAVTAAALALGLPRPVGLRLVKDARVADGLTFNSGGISEYDIPVRLMYARSAGKLVLVWNVGIAQLDQQHYWNAHVDAQTGRLLEQNDLMVSEQTTFYQFMLHAQHQQQRALAFSQAKAPTSVLSPLGTTAASSLTVYPIPLENPNQGTRQAVPLAAVGSAYSPYGWQVAQAPDGTFADTYSFLSTGKYLTRGNNVAAYDDNSNASNGPGRTDYNSSTTSPDGGPALSFDYPFTQASGARSNLAAATTNLFYINNVMHDVMLAHGFDEAAGNFQYKNATGNGKGLDPVRAEAQDGGGRNNASFTSPADGTSGTMQMYLWDNTPTNILTITSPSSIAGTYRFGTASFGKPLSTLPSGFSGTIVVVNDGVSADGGVHSCASPYTNAAAVSGNIALIQRGGCTAPASNNFSDKVKFAQANGAIAAIIFDSNPTSTAPFGLGGTDATVTIPAIDISGADGTRIQNALASGAVVAATAAMGPDFDGSFDNGVMSHEYGHGVSNRLTGTPIIRRAALPKPLPRALPPPRSLWPRAGATFLPSG